MEAQQVGTQEPEEFQHRVASPTPTGAEEAPALGESHNQCVPTVAPEPPAATPETSPLVADTPPFTPCQACTHVVVLEQQQEEAHPLQLSPTEWPALGQPRGRRSEEHSSPPQVTQSLCTAQPSPGAASKHNRWWRPASRSQQRDPPAKPEHLPEVNNNCLDPENIRDVTVSMKNEETLSDACIQRLEAKEGGCEEGRLSVTSSTPTLCASPVDTSLQAYTGDQQQATDYALSSEASTPVPLVSGLSSGPDSYLESTMNASTVIESNYALPDDYNSSDLDLFGEVGFRPKKLVFNPKHWGTNHYPLPVVFSAVPSEYVIGDPENFLPPHILAPGPFLQEEVASTYGQHRSTFVPKCAKNGLILRHSASLPYYNHSGVHDNPEMYATPPPYSFPPPQHSPATYYQHWEQVIEPQHAASHQDLPALQQKSVTEGQQAVFLHQIQVTGHLPMLQPHPPATRHQPLVLLPQAPVNSQVPPALEQRCMINSQQLVASQQLQFQHVAHGEQVLSQQLVASHHQQLQVEQQQTPSSQNELATSQQLVATNPYPPVSNYQQLQVRSQVTVNYPVPETLKQLSVINRQLGLVPYKRPVLQHLPASQQRLPVGNQQKTTVDKELSICPPGVPPAVAEQQSLLPIRKVSPEYEKSQTGVEECCELERPPRPLRPWVADLEASMLRGQAPVRPSMSVPVSPTSGCVFPVQPDFRRPPPAIDYLATALGVNQPVKPTQQHRGNGGHWPEQYQIPPRMLNSYQGKQQCIDPPPLGIPSRRGRGGFVSGFVGRPIRGRGARFTGRSDSDIMQKNGTNVNIANECVPSEEQPKDDTEKMPKDNLNDPIKQQCNSSSEMCGQKDDNPTNETPRQDQNHIPGVKGRRPFRGMYRGRNAFRVGRVLIPSLLLDNTITEEASTTSSPDS